MACVKPVLSGGRFAKVYRSVASHSREHRIKRGIPMKNRFFILTIFLTFLALQTPAVSLSAKVMPPVPSEAAKPIDAQVFFDGKPLFTVRERVLSFSPADRARVISERLAKLAKEPLLRIDSVTVLEGESSTDIVCGDLVIMTITAGDAGAEGKSRRELADAYVQIIRKALEGHNYEYSSRAVLLGALYAGIATFCLAIMLLGINRFFPRMLARIASWRGTRIRTIRIQSLEIVHADRIVSLLIVIAKAVRIACILLLFYIYIPLVFSFFPWTRGYSPVLLHYVTSPFVTVGHAIWNYLPKVFFIAVIALVTHYFLKFVRLFFAEIEKGAISLAGFFPEWAEPTFKIVRFLVIAFAVVVAYPYFPGAESPAFKGVSIFLGVLLSLGSTSAVANIVAGVILTYMRAFKIGDRVKIGETIGDVVEKTLLITRISTIKNVDITIPNSIILGSHIVNYSTSAHEYGVILHTTVTIGYDVPWRTVHALLISAAKATEYIMELPAPFVFQTSLDDFYVSYELNAYTDKPSKMASIYSELHQNIQDRFNESGVEIMSPHFNQIRDGNRMTIPDAYLPKDYVPSGIRIVQSVDADDQASRNEKGERGVMGNDGADERL